MEKVTLEPGVWTRIYGCILQVTSAKAIRVTLGEPTQSINGHAVAPIPDTNAPYFKSQSYDPQVIDLTHWGFRELVNIYLMPDEEQPVDVVVLT